jgi:ABC-type oligopeptide transport system ATPase subunit
VSTLLEVRGLKKYFSVVKGLLLDRTVGWIKAVDDISFSVEEGRTFGLVGESGCGKTTTGRVILLLEKPTKGSILFRGRDVSQIKGRNLHEFRSSVQAVFQDPFSSLNPRMRVDSIVAEPLEVNSKLPRKEVRQRVEKALTQVGLSPEAAMLFPSLRSQRQRIAPSRSLILPKQLSGRTHISIGVSIQAQMMNLLKDLQERTGLAYLLIAHSLATVKYMSHDIGVMYLGKLVERGPVKEVYGNRLHPYTKALFSAALPSHPDLIKEEIVLKEKCPVLPRLPDVISIPAASAIPGWS